jgi:hypothetical protein
LVSAAPESFTANDETGKAHGEVFWWGTAPLVRALVWGQKTLCGFKPKSGGRIPVGHLSLAASARNMPAAPYLFAQERGLHVAGWAPGADACLSTRGEAVLPLGFRDGYDQSHLTSRDDYRYLPTGWTELGLLNDCRHELIRQSFASHPIAQAGYARLQASAPPCP